MSRHSRLSTVSALSGLSATKSLPEDSYQYSLRVAYLAYLSSVRLHSSLKNEDPSQAQSSSSLHSKNSHHRPHLRHQAEAWTNSIFSIADVFKDSNSSKSGKTVKFPKELVKVLKVRIEAIAKGTDKHYQDLLLRSSFGVFYGTYTQDVYLKQLKENRNIEALILLFVTTATGVLRKRLEGDEWKIHLNSQVGVFVTIIRDCLQSKEVKNVPTELMARLDSYASKLAPNSSSNDHQSSSFLTDHRQSPSISNSVATSPADDPSTSAWITSHSIHDMPTVKTIGLLFGVSDSQLQKDLNMIRKTCTEKAAFEDFKLCIAHIARQCRFPGRPSDFDSDEAYREWRTKELASIQQAMLQMIKANPDLAKSKSYTGSNATNNTNMASNSGQDDFVMVGTKDNDHDSASTMTRDNPCGSPSLSNYGVVGLENHSQRNSFPRPESVSSAGNVLNSDYGWIQDTLNQSIDWCENSDAEKHFPATTTMEDHRLSSYMNTEEASITSTQFVYIPPNPITQYISLMDHCLDFDLESMKSLAEDEEVSLKILSPSHLDLLEQCAFRWRLMTPFQVAVFFAAICRRFEEEEIPIIDCVTEALTDVFRVVEDQKFETWATRDKLMMKKIMSSLFDTLLRRVYEAIDLVLNNKPAEDLPNALECLSSIYDSEPFKMITDLEQRFEEFTEAISELYDRMYRIKYDGFFPPEEEEDGDGLNHVVGFLELTAWINSNSNRLNKKFKQPVLDRIDLVAIFLFKLSQNLVQDLDSMKHILIPPPPPPPSIHPTNDLSTPSSSSINLESKFNDSDVLHLYRALLEIEKKHNMCNPNTPLTMPIDHWFFPYVQNWLEATERKTFEWVQSAIKADKFSPEGNDCHSSSIIDLMDSCCSAVDFIQKLNWPDEFQNAKFMTKLSRIISKSIEQYSGIIEKSFVEEMFPKASTDADREANRSAIWTRARLAVQGDKKPEAFQFQESDLKSCVKLNNVEAARVLLDKMYNTIDADNVARIIHEYEPESNDNSESSSSNSYLFTVKIVTAEGLVGPDGSPNKMDPFLTLSNEKGVRIAKTRTLYETSSPTWNETFDISVKGSLWLAATVYKRNLMEKHDYIGRAFLHLNPKLFNDFLAHDLLLDLDTRGRVLIRVSMEGEKDDVQFHFGRAFRSLKRAETDMVRMIIDKISPVIRYYLSHSTLKKLVSSPGLIKGIDISKMSTKIDIDISKVTSYGAELWRSVANSTREQEIPLPREELMATASPVDSAGATSTRIKGPKGLTDADIESAIADLFEYLDQCMSTLRNSLSQKAGQLVMAKIWKEILSIIDSLLLPPLSDQPSEMKPLSGKEVDVVLKWLKFLTNFFHADGEGVPIEDLHNQKYKEIWSIGFFYDQHTDSLMEECVRSMQAQLRKQAEKNSSVARNKSVYQQRNLGTIKKRKADKKKQFQTNNTNNTKKLISSNSNSNNRDELISSELIMRILRLRPGTSDFLSQQISTMVSVNAQQKSMMLSTPNNKNNLSSSSNSKNSVGLSRRIPSNNNNNNNMMPQIPTPPSHLLSTNSSLPSSNSSIPFNPSNPSSHNRISSLYNG